MDVNIKNYLLEGLTIIPAPYKSKNPILEWGKYQTTPPTKKEYEEWFGDEDKKTNINVLCGLPSGNLVVIDIDKFGETTGLERAKIIFGEKWKKLLYSTWVVETGSKGVHIYLKSTQQLIKNLQFARIDIKTTGGLVTIPPSKHPNGTDYKFISTSTNILKFPAIDFIKEMCQTMQKKGLIHKDNIPQFKDENKFSEQHKISTNKNINLKKRVSEPIRVIITNGSREGRRQHDRFLIYTHCIYKEFSFVEILNIMLEFNSHCIPPDKESVVRKHCDVMFKQKSIQEMPKLFSDIPSEEIKYLWVIEGIEHTYYRFVLKNKKYIELDEEEIQTPKRFITLFFTKCRRKIQIKGKNWDEYITYMANHKDTRWDETEDMTFKIEVAEKIIEQIRDTLYVTDNSKWAEGYGIIDEDNILVPNILITHLLKINKWQITIEKLRVFLIEYLKRNSKVIKINKKCKRFWVFDKMKVFEDITDITYKEEEEDEDVM